ncbi:hypothetical protein SARC_06064 [Sphaeroforma arctica JP610]|uniref:HAD family hydrolase n=1 Tax=Sphaeroforma arctica JP610 TaxID=667725 RepID=A0A0L0FYK2_9EUKA|nr:hypothetical protein SARC_06064 [Sphaeroforma arctica JP610]KNC81626.1 hypothetical protein SARC_06064 [Sphaeroforma arctica JP610]|eukprot:XP_014155528.1 hypothetical protein SARC_06064 [Sphaeroforma arctica JP610]
MANPAKAASMALRDRRNWIFDMDGTLTIAMHDFQRIKQQLGLPSYKPILEALDEMPATLSKPIHDKLDLIELEIAANARCMPGALSLLSKLSAQGKNVGILTRNTKPAAEATLQACHMSTYFPSTYVLSRHCAAPKPSPHGLNILMDLWGATPEDTVMIGDFKFDLEAGRNAGVHTVHIDVTRTFAFPDITDTRISSLDELTAIL